MKKLSLLLALIALAFADLVLASAVVTTATGVTQVQTGSAPARPLRTGDRVNQGDTVSTGSASSLVIKFDDGQVAALTANSRMSVTSYTYKPETQRGSSLISLVNGGMRFITGLIGKNDPQNVSVRAATATIGIRGTDFSVATENGVIYAQVNAGVIEFEYNGQKIIIETGRAVLTNPNGTVSQGTINQIFALLQNTDVGRAIAQDIGGLTGLSNAINSAFPGTPTQGQGGPAETAPGIGTGSGVGSPTGPGGGGGGGGGGPPGSPS
jgi:hypothetical protein